jgi:hypothetical protein
MHIVSISIVATILASYRLVLSVSSALSGIVSSGITVQSRTDSYIILYYIMCRLLSRRLVHRIPLGIPFVHESGISHIERILKYSHIDDDTGQLIRASVEQLKLEIGCNGPTLSLPYADFSKLATNCWIRQTWQFMDAHQIRIEDTTPDFLLSRANDQLLIPLFHEKGIRDDHLHRLNLCRLFFK